MFTRISISILIGMSLSLLSCGSGKINKSQSEHQAYINMSKMNNEVVVSMDTVFYKGEAYAILKEEGLSMAPFYNFYSISGEKAIRVLPYSAQGNATSHHEYNFFGTSEGMKAYDDFSFSTISVCETVINNNLMSTTGLRPIDVGNFVKNHPRPPKFNAASLKVRRELTKEIKVNQGSGEIYQDDKLIGKFTQGSEKSADLKQGKAVFKVQFIGKTECATVKFGEFKVDRNDNPNMEIITEFDGQFHRMNINENNRTFDIDAFRQAVQFLVEKGYL